jgi:hypothetical protein
VQGQTLSGDFDKDFRQFDHELRDFAEKQVPEEVNKVKRAVALQLLVSVVQDTRVDTGRARGGWSVALDEASTRKLKRLDKTGNHVVALGSRKIAEAEFGQDIWISNNVQYIDYLNSGTETRTGDFMVERALVTASAQFQ